MLVMSLKRKQCIKSTNSTKYVYIEYRSSKGSSEVIYIWHEYFAQIHTFVGSTDILRNWFAQLIPKSFQHLDEPFLGHLISLKGATNTCIQSISYILFTSCIFIDIKVWFVQYCS